MGRNGRTKAYGKVVGKDASDRPGWKGPGFVKKKPANPPKEKPAKEEEEEDVSELPIPLELQQVLLNIFKDTFPEVLTSESRQQLLQDVKNALYERDFARAFGRQDYLETYSIRWSPSRALCYQSILVDVSEHLVEIFPLCASIQLEEEVESVKDVTSSTLRAVCFGGGAAEVVAFGGFLKLLHDSVSKESTEEDYLAIPEGVNGLSVAAQITDIEPSKTSTSESDTTITSATEIQASMACPGVDLVLVDSAQWGDVVQKLQHSIISLPSISKYASAFAKAANAAMLSGQVIKTTFLAEDVLTMTALQMRDLFGKTSILLTLLFTLNELYTSSISLTTKFLLNLTMAAKPGSLLLVVDSPGSYSETKVNGSSKKYPMHWLLDHTLLDTAKADNKAVWEKLVSDDSKWFRIPEDLRYPISLENMRYQIHLYRRL
ncbi:uncharacterized protein PAC_02993 [Phialocephala subalpina]|uniref:25S rRNA (Uridine(2843)-N(3))-methyltransferase n=1 Tax=Phialocephala subalpina TaxID=576137 RepID=A0A1L7WK12_9HELO|nr:uncharacterized protein PAC_02993 [Phialocephala subalpina]